MRTGEFWEGGSPFLCSPDQPQKKQDVTVPLNKVLSHVANIVKNNGLIYITRVNKTPELMGQSVYS